MINEIKFAIMHSWQECLSCFDCKQNFFWSQGCPLTGGSTVQPKSELLYLLEKAPWCVLKFFDFLMWLLFGGGAFLSKYGNLFAC